VESINDWKFRPSIVNGKSVKFCGKLALELDATEHGVTYKLALPAASRKGKP
jgi:hypothetical protein